MNEKCNNFPWSLERGTSRIFDPQCKTEILRWFAQEDIPRQQKEDFIQALIDFEDGCGGFYRYRAYFLAAEALAYFPDCDKGDEIVRQLLRWSYAYFQEFPNWEKFPIPLVRAAQQVLERTDRRRVIAAFVEKVHTTESRFVLRHAAERLGKLDPGNKSAISQSRIVDAIAALVLLMQRSQEPYTIWKATHSLMAIDPENPAIAPTLIALIEKLPTHSRYLWKIAEAIIDVDPNYPTLIPTLIALTQKLPSTFNVLRDAIEILGKVGEGNEAAIDALIRLTEITPEQLRDRALYSDSSESLREVAAENLGKIAVGHPNAIAALLKLVATVKKTSSTLTYWDTRIYWKAVDALGEIAVGDKTAIATLTEIVQTHPDLAIRCAAAVSLSKIDAGNTIAISVLSQALEALPEEFPERSQTTLENRSLRWLIADRLANTDDYWEAAIATLREIVCSPKFYPEPPALSSLARIDSTYELAIETVFQLLRQPISIEGSTSLADYLYCLGSWLEDTPKTHLRDRAIAELTEFIRKSLSEDDFACLEYPLSIAAVTLGKLDPGNSLAVSTLVRLIEACDLSDLLRGSAYRLIGYCRNLAEIGASDRIPVDKIVECFSTVCDEENNEQFFLEIAQMLTQGQLKMPKHSLLQLVRSLKPYLGESFYRNPSHCYDACYQIIWHCSQHLSYLEFYQAWQE